MKSVIFKNEKKAKAYEIRSVKAQGVYTENELIRRVKTDDIKKLINGLQYEVTAVEIEAA